MPQRFTSLAEWLAWFETLHPKKIDLSLDRIRVVLDALGLVPPGYTVVTVGGTNGKGSCVAILESIYRAAGYRVGAFTSPHLVRFNERIRFDGRDATDAELIELFESIDASLGDVTLSYFEASAVAALLCFERRRADVAVLEVGMGGRLDAVNALDADAALIASVDLDHTAWLGPDREAIGREKAGIMRGGRPAVVGDSDPPQSLAARADEIGARLLAFGRDFRATRDGQGWRFEGPDAAVRDGLPIVPFGAEIQLANMAACVAVVDALRDARPVSEDALRAGLANARLRGRTERHMRDGVEWIFDVAHNPSAARVLRQAVEGRHASRTLAVFAAMEDKDLDGVLAPFADLVDRWHVSRPDSERGAPLAAVARTLDAIGAREPVLHADVASACRAAAAEARPGERVLVFGSFYTVGPALEALRLYSTPPAVGS
ncbi:MAG TPA: bifunctional tetrahydrofolate synthase/dihydrofolate synthase [Gammaproteobacteria bacterium]